MAAVHHPEYSFRDSCPWVETDCLNNHRMLSLHEVFEVVGFQLTETDVDVLSFLVNETCRAPHPSDLAEPDDDDSEDRAVEPNPGLMRARERLKPRRSQELFEARHRPSNGVELLLELEKRGYLSDGNLRPLLELLRVLTRHDLLHLVSHKKRRTVSPERTGKSDGRRKWSVTAQLKTSLSGQRWRKKKRGHGWTRRPKRRIKDKPEPPPPEPQYQPFYNIRLTVRVDYLDHEATLRSSVSSDKQEPLERQFDLFSRATSVLRSRDLGCIICNIKFTDRDSLDAFWRDYMEGDLLEALKAVFITNALRTAAGGEEVHLLISINQDDYEEGRCLLKPADGSRSHSPTFRRGSEMILA